MASFPPRTYSAEALVLIRDADGSLRKFSLQDTISVEVRKAGAFSSHITVEISGNRAWMSAQGSGVDEADVLEWLRRSREERGS